MAGRQALMSLGVALSWAAAEATHPDESESGDGYLIRDVEGGSLVAIVDGLGHGPEAGAAARTAMAVLDSLARWTPAEAIMACHDALLRTRGAVMSCASVDGRGRLTWAGVGNVEAVVSRAGGGPREWLAIPGGIVGHHLPALHEGSVQLRPADTLAFATDGITPRFVQALDSSTAIEVLADRILAGYRRGIDDALVVIGRYGAGSE